MSSVLFQVDPIIIPYNLYGEYSTSTYDRLRDLHGVKPFRYILGQCQVPVNPHSYSRNPAALFIALSGAPRFIRVVAVQNRERFRVPLPAAPLTDLSILFK